MLIGIAYLALFLAAGLLLARWAVPDGSPAVAVPLGCGFGVSLLAALPAINTVPPVNSPPSAASRAAVALSRLGIRTSVRRSTSRKSLPVRPTKVNREEPSPDTSKLTGMVPP